MIQFIQVFFTGGRIKKSTSIPAGLLFSRCKKKFLFSILLILQLFVLHCPLTNRIVLKPGRVSGREAKEIIYNRISSFFIKDITDSNSTALLGDYLMPTLAGVKDTSIYRRRDIENCSTKIILTGIAIDWPSILANRTVRPGQPLQASDPNSRFIPPLFCQLEEVSQKLVDLD